MVRLVFTDKTARVADIPPISFFLFFLSSFFFSSSSFLRFFLSFFYCCCCCWLPGSRCRVGMEVPTLPGADFHSLIIGLYMPLMSSTFK